MQRAVVVEYKKPIKMIILPTRQRLEKRREKLYTHLNSIISCSNRHQVENIMRQIHFINLRLRTYFKSAREPKEIFSEQEDNDITTQDTAHGENTPTIQDIAQIEAEIKAGKI